MTSIDRSNTEYTKSRMKLFLTFRFAELKRYDSTEIPYDRNGEFLFRAKIRSLIITITDHDKRTRAHFTAYRLDRQSF